MGVFGSGDDLTAQIGADTSGFEAGIAGLIGSLGGLQGALIAAAGVAAATFAGMAAVSGTAVSSAIDLESAFAGVQKTVEGTPEQLEEVKDGLLGLSEEVPLARDELFGIAEAAGQLGVAREDVVSFTRTIADLAATTNLGAEDGAKTLARFMNIMGSSQDEVDNLGSTVVDLGNNFATTESEIAEMAQRIAGAGKVTGLTEADVLGMSAALSSVGVEAQMGGSAVSRIMLRIQKSVEGASGEVQDFSGEIEDLERKKSELESRLAIGAQRMAEFGENTRESTKMAAAFRQNKLQQDLQEVTEELRTLEEAQAMPSDGLEEFARVAGMSADEFRAAWEDNAAGALESFIEGLARLDEDGESVTGTLEDLGFSNIRITDTLLRSANAGDLFGDAIATANKAWADNTALAEEAEKRYQTTASQLQITRNRVDNLAASFGEKLLPATNDVLEGFNDLLSGDFEGFIEGVREGGAKFARVWVGVFDSLQDEIARQISAVDWNEAAKGLGAWYSQLWDDIGDSIEAFDWRGAGVKIGRTLTETIGTYILNTDWVALVAVIAKALGGLILFTAGIIEGVIRVIARGLRDGAIWVYQASLDLGREIVAGVGDGLKRAGSSAKDKIKDFAIGLIGRAKTTFGIRSPSKVFYEMGLNLIEGLSGGVSDSGPLATDSVRSLSDSLIGELEQRTNDWRRVGEGYGEAIAVPIQDTVARLPEFIDNALGDAVSNAAGLNGPSFARMRPGQRAIARLAKMIAQESESVREVINVPRGVPMSPSNMAEVLLSQRRGIGTPGAGYLGEVDDPRRDALLNFFGIRDLTEAMRKLRAVNFSGFAHGFEGMVRRPSLMLVGEHGPERVSVKKNSHRRDDGGGTRPIMLTVYASGEREGTEAGRAIARELRRLGISG